MSIKVFNTLSRQKEEFKTVRPGKVGMYVCGPTVYSKSHIGHMVGPVIFDAIKRYLQYSGYDVTFVINITDIDDKIINQAAKDGVDYQDLAKRVAADYKENLGRLGVGVDHYPHATEYVDEILRIIGGLVDKGFAYPAGGDVYFDVTKDDDYGKLSNRKLDELLAGVRKEVNDVKHHPGDFALWKGAKPGEPSWPSPWGPGRPGWHIECTAMSTKLLGDTFDIHGGGLDLCFPHHEDEIAQSESFTGKPFANYWMHNGLMQYSSATRKIGAREGDYASQEEDKMSKSKGNVVTIADLLAKYSPDLVRFFLLSTHYRRPIDFSDDRLAEVQKGLAKFPAFAERYQRITGQSFYDLSAPTRRSTGASAASLDGLKQQFLDHMDDDFNTGGAVGVLFEMLNAANRLVDEQKLEASPTPAGKQDLIAAATVLKELLGILGIMQTAPTLSAKEDSQLVGGLVELLLELRQELRKAKNFALADQIRQKLAGLNVIVEDSPAGSRWKIGS